ncbi:MAG: hypothetical protein QQN41_05915 [Nitrosopumilus sp.]
MIEIIIDNAQSGGTQLKLVGLNNVVLASTSIEDLPKKDDIKLWALNLSITDLEQLNKKVS